jgi:hypothetical protein
VPNRLRAPIEDGVHFVDVLPEPPKGSVLAVHRINGQIVAGFFVSPEHGGTREQPFPEVIEGAWEFYHRRCEAIYPRAAADTSARPGPRRFEVL